MKPTLLSSSFCNFLSRGRKLAGFAFCLFVLAGVALGQTYVNNNAINYNEPNGPLLPQIEDPAFDNQSIFSVTYDLFLNNQIEFCQPWTGTLFYTNNGEMIVNAPFDITNTLDSDTTGAGFEFDLFEGNSNVMAGTFYNPGTIHCDSVLDGNNVINFGGFSFFIQTSIGGLIISATNIIDSGTNVVGIGGLLSMDGQYVNLTRSVLTMETGENEPDVTGNAPFSGSGTFGLNTNFWDPSVELTATTAESADLPTPPFNLFLTNSTPYFQQPFPVTGSNTVVVRSAFIQDTSASNVAYSVYFNTGSAGLGGGDVTVQWAGTYLNSANGKTLTNYLYLNDDYVESGSSNIGTANGYPDNFTLTASSTPLITQTPANAGFQTIFLSGTITNRYAFGSFSGMTTSETNVSVINPNGTLTNLPNRIVINANRELNLSLAQMSGQVYTSLTATNQYDGSGGALIASPFSDLNLGVTNGTLAVSNLLESQFPEWSGNIQAWSTRWLETDTNSGITYDFRVLLVGSQLSPITQPQVDNLTLSSASQGSGPTNQVVISDLLNVFGPVFVNAQSMTLTTNAVGFGATSVEGVLNMENANNPTWSWVGSFPYLQNLTNNGIIIAPNYNAFTSTTQAIVSVTSTPPVAAVATLSEIVTNSANNMVTSNSVTIGFPGSPTTYIFTNQGINKSTPPYFVKIGASLDLSLSNLIAAINFTNGMGTLYSTNSGFANSLVTAGPLNKTGPPGTHSFVITSKYTGSFQDNVSVSATATNVVWNSSSLSGGSNGTTGSTNLVSTSIPYNAIVNSGLLSDQGSAIWANNFVNGGIISNGVNSFTLNAITGLMTNGSLTAGGDVSFTANTLEISNLMLQAGRSLTLAITNSFTDGGVTNGNVWVVDSTNATGFNGLGLILPILPTNTATVPATNNLLGTTISMNTPSQVNSTWAGLDYGASTLGYNTNNMAIGQLILNSPVSGASFYFSGVAGSSNNAIYVDRLVLLNYASYANALGTADIPTLLFNTNVVIYYADAVSSSTVNGGPLEDLSFELNGFNGNHLRWVPQYTGYFSTTNIVYPGGTTYAVNVGLALSTFDSSGVLGEPNYLNPNPVFEPSQVNFKFALTNVSSTEMGWLTWNTIPGATNSVLYTTNLMSKNWSVVTNFVSPGQFVPASAWPIATNILEPLHNTTVHGYYRVGVNPLYP